MKQITEAWAQLDTALGEIAGALTGEPREATEAALVLLRELRRATEEREADYRSLRLAWEEFLSAQETIYSAQWHDNYTDAARARERQAKAIENARATLAFAKGGRRHG